jgi:hypothetical protein
LSEGGAGWMSAQPIAAAQPRGMSILFFLSGGLRRWLGAGCLLLGLQFLLLRIMLLRHLLSLLLMLLLYLLCRRRTGFRLRQVLMLLLLLLLEFLPLLSLSSV